MTFFPGIDKGPTGRGLYAKGQPGLDRFIL